MPSIAQYQVINDQTLLIIPLNKINPEREHRFLNPIPQNYPAFLYQGSLVSINHRMDVVYQYQRGHHLVTASGRLLWIKDDQSMTLKEMELSQNYENYRSLSYSNLNDQIFLSRQRNPNSKITRVGNALKTILPDVTILQQCKKQNCTVFPERHIYGIQSSFIPVLCNISPNDTIANMHFNLINFGKMTKLHSSLYHSTSATNKTKFKEMIARQTFQILQALQNKTKLSLNFIRVQ